MVLFFLYGFCDVASDKFDDEYFFAIFDDVGVVDDEFEAIGDDLFFGEDRLGFIRNRLPVLCGDLSREFIHAGEDSNQLVKLVLL